MMCKTEWDNELQALVVTEDCDRCNCPKSLTPHQYDEKNRCTQCSKGW